MPSLRLKILLPLLAVLAVTVTVLSATIFQTSVVEISPAGSNWLFRALLACIGVLFVYMLLVDKYRARQSHINADRLKTLLKNLPGMAYRCFNRKNWPMEFASEGCYTLCGYHRYELEEQKVLWGTFTHPEEIEMVEKTILEAVGRGEPFEVEYRIITRSGKIKWVWERGRVVDSNESDEIVLEGFITDITDRKLAETALVQAESYAKAVVDAAVEAVITVDDSGNIETFNRAAQQMFGYALDEVIGRNILLLMPETEHEEYEEFIAHYLQSNKSKIIGMSHELTAKHREQTEFPIHLSISKVSNQAECKYVFLIRDLSMQRAAEKEAREQREQLAHVDRLNTLGEMATGIAHEINQPLTAISMYAQSGLRFLNSRMPRLERLRDALNKLSVQAHRAGAVIERMQMLGKQHDTEREEIDCNTLIRDVYKLAEIEAHVRYMDIALELAGDLPPVNCDPVQIQQVVLNLMRNGMESMKSVGCRNGNQIVLKTEPDTINGGVKISIIDSGSGITDEEAEQIFQPFSSTKDTGMGLGLSISRSIVRAHGGQLEFTNNRESGATFYFSLPRARREKS